MHRHALISYCLLSLGAAPLAAGCASSVLGPSGSGGDESDDEDDDGGTGGSDSEDESTSDDPEPPRPGLTTGSSDSGSGEEGEDEEGEAGEEGEDEGEEGDSGDSGPMTSACGHGGYERVVDNASREAAAREACGDDEYSDDFTPGYELPDGAEEEIATLVNAMDLSAKANQMRGTEHGGGTNWTDIFRSQDDSTFDVKGFQFRDGPRGVSLEAGCDGNCYATTFPVSIARGAAFDICLEHEIGRAQGDEMLASGHTMMLAPMVNLLRHTGWGRSQEGYSEDPFVSGRMGSAYTVGVQEFVPACVKHYIANNIENGRETLNVDLDEQSLHEIFGRAFEMVVKDAGVACVMLAYNRVNGLKNTQNAPVVNDMLRGDFGFRGMTLSDWWAVEGGAAGFGKQEGEQKDIASQALLGGLDMELPWSLYYTHIEALVGDGTVPQSVINDSVRRILETKVRFNLVRGGDLGLKDPSTGFDSGNDSITNNSDHVQLAYNSAAEGIVLMKNDDSTLPIDMSAVGKIAILSASVPFALNPETTSNQAFSSGTVNFATSVLTGDEGSSRMREDPALAYSPLEGFEARAQGTDIEIVSGDNASVAEDADFIVVMAGLNAGDEGEEYTGAGDRHSFALDDKIDGTPQEDLIRAAAALGKPMVVVLIGGGVIDMPWLDDVPAVMMAWYPGMVGGLAIADIVFGYVNPSGKLPISWAPWEDMPNFSLQDNSIDQEYFVGYRYFEDEGRTPMYPFGYGLSYTSFEYQNLEVPCSSISSDGVAEVKVDVYNAGDVPGHEVVFMFASYPDASDARKRVKKLQGFYRVFLEPGQAKQVMMPLRVSELRFWDEGQDGWVIEPGDVRIEVGPNADDLPLSETLTIE